MDFEIANSSTRSCVAVIPQTEYDLCESKFACVGIIMHCAKCLNNVKHEPIDRNHEQKIGGKTKIQFKLFCAYFYYQKRTLWHLCGLHWICTKTQRVTRLIVLEFWKFT